MDHSRSKLAPTVLSIAGSDPSGGAGIQADLKTITAIGVYGAAAITCITVQNSLGVSESVALAGDLVVRQVQAVLADYNVTHIKIGMIGTIEIATALGQLLGEFKDEVIYDPVLSSTMGQSLLNSTNLSDLSNQLISKVTVLTPNLAELEQLCQQPMATPEAAIRGARQILDRHEHLQAVIVKGGHLEIDKKYVSDYLILKNQEQIATSTRQRIKSHNLHGTGCTYASAFAAFHCLEKDYRKAFVLSAAYMDRIISKSSSILLIKSGKGGPLIHTW